jgi:hypothetical protein
MNYFGPLVFKHIWATYNPVLPIEIVIIIIIIILYSIYALRNFAIALSDDFLYVTYIHHGVSPGWSRFSVN